MADPVSNDDSTSADGIQPSASGPEDSVREWVLNYLNPVRDTSADIINKGLGPLSLEAINGSPLLYTNPQAYFAALRVNNPELFADTVSGDGGNNDLIGSVGIPDVSAYRPRTAPQNEFNLDYAPPGSLVRYDPVHPFSGDEGPSIYVTAHPAFESVAPWDPEYHTAIRIVGTDGVVDTLGGQPDPSTGNLVSVPNYLDDQKAAAIVRLPVPADQTPQQFAENLRAAAAAYGNDQPYSALPGWEHLFNGVIFPVPGSPKIPFLGIPGYNSNSYVAGVIRAAGGIPPTLPVDVPGYGKPLPFNYAPNR